MNSKFIVTADTEPILDRWGWADYWGNEDWIKWHRLNVEKYGLTKANEKFSDSWNSQDMDAHPYNWAKYDSNFANYFSKNGVNVGHLISNTVVKTGNVVKSIENTVENLGTTAEKTTKTLSYILPVFLIVILITATIILYKKYSK